MSQRGLLNLMRFILLSSLSLLSCGQGDKEIDQLRLYLTRFDRFYSESSLYAYSVPDLQKLGKFPANRMAARVCADPELGSLWMSGEISNTIQIFDTLNDSTVFSINVEKPATGGAFSPDGRYFLVGNSAVVAHNLSESFATLIDVRERKVIATLPVGEDPRATCFSADSRRGFVTNTADGTLSVIDVESVEVVATVPTAPGPVHAVLDPQGRWLYVAGIGIRLEDGARGQGEVAVHALPGLEIIARLQLGEHPARVTPYAEGTRIIVNEMRCSLDGVSWLRLYDVLTDDGVSCRQRCELDVGSNPISGDLSPDEDLFAVIDFDQSRLSLVDMDRERVMRSITLPEPGKAFYSVDVVFARHLR
ncbi:MAG: YncE family protein [bacterium]|nr:YncE family protein [bacterium]